MSEKLCLQWNDFKGNAISSFESLREDRDFTDVTLACEDGKQVEAHKVILASSSPFFQNLLKMNKHPHPLIYMRGVKSDDLLAIVDFLYCGVAKVFQENLDSFLSIAEELQLKGLVGKVDGDEVTQIIPVKTSPKTGNQIFKGENSSKSSGLFQNEINDKIPDNEHHEVGKTVALTSSFSDDVQELDEKCNSMMEKTFKRQANGYPLYRCGVCGKEGINTQMKNHIEANHLEGVSMPCNFCEKTFRSRNALAKHSHKYHKSNTE